MSPKAGADVPAQNAQTRLNLPGASSTSRVRRVTVPPGACQMRRAAVGTPGQRCTSIRRGEHAAASCASPTHISEASHSPWKHIRPRYSGPTGPLGARHAVATFVPHEKGLHRLQESYAATWPPREAQRRIDGVGLEGHQQLVAAVR